MRHSRLLLGKVLGVGCGCPVDCVNRGHKAVQGQLAVLQPGSQLYFAGITDLRAGDQRDNGKHDRQAQQGESVVRNFKKASGNAARIGSKTFGETFSGCHSYSFFGRSTLIAG